MELYATGTIINVIAVLVGGGIGTLVGARLPEGIRSTAMSAIGIVTLLVGVQNFFETDNPLIPLVSVVVGLIVGEILGIERGLKTFGDYLERRFSRGDSPVSRAFVTTSLLFCVGPLTILGSLEDGLTGNYELLVDDVAGAVARVREAFAGRGEVDELDGTTITGTGDGPMWWFNLRASNTEPLLRLNAEAADRATMEAVRDEVLALVRQEGR